MIEMLLPLLVKEIVGIFTSSPETVQTAVDVAKENPLMVTGAFFSVPGLILEFALRRFKTEKRKSILLGIKKIVFIARKILEFAESAIDYIDKQGDKVIPQKLKEPELKLPGE